MSEDDGEESDFYCDYCGSGSHSMNDCYKQCECEEYPGQHAGSCY